THARISPPACAAFEHAQPAGQSRLLAHRAVQLAGSAAACKHSPDSQSVGSSHLSPMPPTCPPTPTHAPICPSTRTQFSPAWHSALEVQVIVQYPRQVPLLHSVARSHGSPSRRLPLEHAP